MFRQLLTLVGTVHDTKGCIAKTRIRSAGSSTKPYA